MPEPRYVELDVMVQPCEGCGRITANPWLLCTVCTDQESDDREFWGPVRVADPNATAGH